MKIREINEGLGDVGAAIGSGLYKATGGLIGSKQAAIERNFISNFNNQLSRSARTGGPAFDMEDYLNAYAQQLGWPLSEKEKSYIKQLADTATNSKYSSGSINPIGKLMYSLADKYRRIQAGGAYSRTPTKTKTTNTPGTTGTSATPPAPPPPTSPAAGPVNKPVASGSTTAGKILNALGRVYREPTAKTDLEKIMRDAAYLLARLDKGRYSATLRDLTSGAGGVSAASVKASEPGTTAGTSTTPPTTASPQPKVTDVNKVMPGYSKASDDLEHKMKPSAPAQTPAQRAYRPGSRRPTVTDVIPKARR